MNFDEMKKIWDLQNNAPLYRHDEQALYNQILSKKKQTTHITNSSELLVIWTNSCSGLFILGVNFFDSSRNPYMYLLAAWMLASAVYGLVSRIQRIKRYRFDRTVLDDLSYAISLATYQVRLSQIMRWNILPIGALTLLGVWEGGKSFWIIGLILVFFVIAYYGSAKEHSIYIRKKRELELLESKLEKEDLTNPSLKPEK